MVRMVRVYELAKKRFPDYDEWGVSYSTNPVFHPFGVWQALGYHAHGTECSVQELLFSARFVSLTYLLRRATGGAGGARLSRRLRAAGILDLTQTME